MAEENALKVEIYKDQDFYVPAFVIIVGQEKLNPVVLNDILNVTYTDSLANVDSFDMTINNWDAGANKFDQTAFKYSDKDTFNPWKDVEVQMGYYRNGKSELRTMLIGEITTLTPNFPQGGAPTLNVRGLNLFHRFRTKQETKPFFNKKDSQIAKEIVESIATEIRKKSPQLKLKLDQKDFENNIKQEDPIPYLLMNNQFPIRFLMERARDLGYELTMEEARENGNREVTFHYRRTSDVKRKTYILEWGVSLISFQPTLQCANQVAELTVRGWNPKTKKEIKVTVKRSEIKGIVTPSELGVNEPDLTKKVEIVIDRPVSNEAEAKLLATNRLKQIGEVLVEGKGKTIGVPDLRAGSKVEIKGLGTRFSGTYLVTGTTHSIGDGGYTTDFTGRMEKL
jgi:Bacteriophage probable baseplate hub protein